MYVDAYMYTYSANIMNLKSIVLLTFFGEAHQVVEVPISSNGKANFKPDMYLLQVFLPFRFYNLLLRT